MSIEETIKGLGDFSKSLVIGLAIIILTIFVSVYGINTFYEKPEYSNFCGEKIVKPLISDTEEKICPSVCVEMYEIKENACSFNACGSGCGPDGINTFEKLSQCEIVLSGKNCYNLYDDARKTYSRNIFLIAIPLGVIIIVLGIFLFSLNSVGIGLMLGGIGTLIYGIGGYWRYTENWLRFLISLIGLVALIWLAYWFNRKSEKKERSRKKK